MNTNDLNKYYNINIEQCVLSILINKNEAYDDVSHIINMNFFYIESNKHIFTTIQKMLSQGQRADILTIMHALGNRENAEYISEIANIYIPPTSIIQYVEMLKELYMRRELFITLNNVNSKLEKNENTEECFNDIEKLMGSINNSISSANIVSLNTVGQVIIKEIANIIQNPNHVNGIQTGFSQLNVITGGFKPGELIILAGRPSVGKTAFALNLAISCAKNNQGGGVLFISLEMTPEQITKRILSSISSIPLNGFITGHMNKTNFAALLNVVKQNENIPIYIYDSFIININKLRSALRQYKRLHNIKLVIIDYLQLITSTQKYTSREQEVSDISRSLKLMAKELNLPIISLSQMSRDVEKRQTVNNAPKLSDLRSSGAIEQDADIVLFLFRHTNNDIEDRTKIICNVAKNRNGALGDILFNYNGETTTFNEYSSIIHSNY